MPLPARERPPLHQTRVMGIFFVEKKNYIQEKEKQQKSVIINNQWLIKLKGKCLYTHTHTY
jgi:hypothetical protein